MPVFPLVGSSSRRPGSSSPEASAASIIAFAIRSLIEPVGFWPSSFAYSRTDGSGVRRGSSTRGVPPIRSRTLGAVALAATAGHGRKQDDGIGRRDGGLVAVARADVLAADVDVRELELAAERREARREVVEEVADGLALGKHLALPARVVAERRRNPYDAHAPTSNSPAPGQRRRRPSRRSRHGLKAASQATPL